jgi:hypothetical protein
MIVSRIAWAAWALVPVVGVAYHFGPGQTAAQRDKATRIQGEAIEAEKEAESAQAIAYGTHLAALEARKAAFLSQSSDNESKALEATKREDAAYARASLAWKSVAEKIEAVQRVFTQDDSPEARQLRLAHARAQVRSGKIWDGIDSLEGLLNELPNELSKEVGDSGAGEGSHAGTAFESKTREELATAYYYGARILRLSGMPAQEWMLESGKARQQFRYLAESERAAGDAQATNHQRNLELVLNLEQSSLAELQGKPIPRDSPCNCAGNRPSEKGKKSQRPPQQKKDARGAGGAGAIPPGW